MKLDIFKHKYNKHKKIEILEQFYDLTRLEKWLILDEDFLTRAYKDSKGIWTDGVGNTSNVVPNGTRKVKEVVYELRKDVSRSVLDYISIFGDSDFSFGKEDPRQIALVNMLFNLGKPRFLKFKNMIVAVKRKDWERAADEVLYKDGLNFSKGRSDYYYDVRDRANRIAKVLRTGKYIY